jgi:SecD/SecF fusion protein
MAWLVSLPVLFAQAASEAAKSPAATDAVQLVQEASPGLSGFIKLAVAVAILLGSFLLGSVLAKALRLPEFAFKLGLVLLSIIASVAICYFGWPPKLGIDLSGGVVLVYEVEGSQVQSNNLEDFARMLGDQLNRDRDEKVIVKVVDDHIEFVVPKDGDVGRLERQIADLGGQGSRLASVGKRKEGDLDVLIYDPDKSLKKVDMEKLVAAVTRRVNPGGLKEVTIRQYGPEQIEVIIPEVEQTEIKTIKDLISTAGALEFRILANPRKPEHRDIITRAQASPAEQVVDSTPEGRRVVAKWVNVGRELGVENPVVRTKPNGKGLEVLVIMDPFNVTGQYLRRASPDIDQTGRDCISFSFNSEGAQLFGALTGANLPDPATGMVQHLGIVLDSDLISAPRLQSQIRDQGQITGGFDKQYVETVVGVLNAGSLPTALQKQPISEQRISAQLGAETIESGRNAMLIATAGVVLFMLYYYRFAGAVADFAVVLNMVMAVALMILIKAAFTLPGLAGLVLTVGMAVDANVLIYERMREEQQRGASLRMAIRNGFARAMSTIIDSNVTTILTGVVLFAIGTDQIKGFAVTLILGLLVSMYTAVYVARLIFDIAEKKRWLTRLNMAQWFKKTNFDFIRLYKPALVLSMVVIAAGLIGVAARGKDLLDIDFTGGSSVTVQFRSDKPQDIAAVRKAVADLPDVAVSGVGTNNLEFKIDTSERKIDVVRDKLTAAFGDALNTYSMSIGEFQPFVPAKEEPAKQPADKPLETTKPEPKSTETKPEEKPAETKPQASPETSEPKQESTTPPADAKPGSSKPEPLPPTTEKDKSSALERRGPVSPSQLAVAMMVVGKDEPDSEEKEPKTEPAAPSQAVAGPADASAAPVGTTVELSFPGKISYPTLRDRIADELQAENLAGTFFELRNPDYSSGSSARYEKWTLDILVPREQTDLLLKNLQTKLADEPIFPSANEIGGKVAGDTQMLAIYAILASLVMIVVYVWIRFQNALFGFAAVAALVHDVLVALGFLALSYWMANDLGMGVLLVDPFKISLAVVAALLTIVGFSINDTIVIFDRIREIRGKSPELTGAMINQAVNETLSRTFITSGTVFIATVILYIFGGAGIHPFAFAMLVGVISGTYSTIYIAAPLLLLVKPTGRAYGAARPSSSTPARAR